MEKRKKYWLFGGITSLVAIAGTAIGISTCSGNEWYERSPRLAERVYEFSLPRRMVVQDDRRKESIKTFTMEFYKSLAEQLGEKFEEVDINPGVYKCGYEDSSMDVKCKERVVFTVSRRCQYVEDGCDGSTPQDDKDFLTNVIGRYSKMVGESGIDVKDTPSIKRHVHVGYSSVDRHAFFGEEADFSTLTPNPKKDICDRCAKEYEAANKKLNGVNQSE